MGQGYGLLLQVGVGGMRAVSAGQWPPKDLSDLMGVCVWGGEPVRTMLSMKQQTPGNKTSEICVRSSLKTTKHC